MALVTGIVLPNNGDRIKATDISDPINKILAQVNGNLDSTNIASLTGTKISAASLPVTALDSTVGAGWMPSSDVFTYGSNNGNKEFTVTTPGDQSGKYSVGMKMKFTRGTVPPTQSMAFVAASSQYATKASPTGITFTGAFTCEAWAYLNSYTGLTQVVIGRSDIATGGFFLFIDANGRPAIEYGGSSNFTNFIAYQSIPLNRWVHIAGVVTSVASKTALIYINGISVPVQSTLTAATTLVQTSNLSVGGGGAGVANSFFNGYISEARVWSVAQSQAQIQANMAVNLLGSEANLVALFKGGANFTDSTSNANTLSAINGAIATQAANPYNAIEYAIVTKVSYVNPNTTLTLFAGTDYTIPNGPLASPNYSASRAPTGFPAARGKWIVDALLGTNISTGLPAAAWTASVAQLMVPTGEWKLGSQGVCQFLYTSGSGGDSSIAMSSTSTPPGDLTTRIQLSPTGTYVDSPVNRDTYAVLATVTPYLMYGYATTGASASFILLGLPQVTASGPCFKMVAECALL